MDYTCMARAYSATPTLFVTGNLLERYPLTFRRLASAGAEFGVHGYVHTDYARLSRDRQKTDLTRALAAFERLGIPAGGFRSPYLRWNADSVAVARELGLEYGSNRGIAWKVLGAVLNGVDKRGMNAYERGLRLYDASPSSGVLSLPEHVLGLLDFPASLPDDEALVDRLRLPSDGRRRAWSEMLRTVHDRGELLVHTLHHERLALCRAALMSMLEEAKNLRPPVWFASLREIAGWWRRRLSNPIGIHAEGEGRYRVISGPGPEATILVRGANVAGARAWWNGWSVIDPGASFEALSPPFISLSPESPPGLANLLKDEGFIVRFHASGEGGMRLKARTSFSRADALSVLQEVDASAGPLVRLWRWPSGARCAVSLTGDVDSMTLLDFLRRPLEV